MKNIKNNSSVNYLKLLAELSSLIATREPFTFNLSNNDRYYVSNKVILKSHISDVNNKNLSKEVLSMSILSILNSDKIMVGSIEDSFYVVSIGIATPDLIASARVSKHMNNFVLDLITNKKYNCNG